MKYDVCMCKNNWINYDYIKVRGNKYFYYYEFLWWSQQEDTHHTASIFLETEKKLAWMNVTCIIHSFIVFVFISLDQYDVAWCTYVIQSTLIPHDRRVSTPSYILHTPWHCRVSVWFRLSLASDRAKHVIYIILIQYYYFSITHLGFGLVHRIKSMLHCVAVASERGGAGQQYERERAILWSLGSSPAILLVQ